MKMTEIAKELIEIVIYRRGNLLPPFNEDFKEAIAEAEVIEAKAEAFNRIRKYCTEELWNSILDEVKVKMKEEKE